MQVISIDSIPNEIKLNTQRQSPAKITREQGLHSIDNQIGKTFRQKGEKVPSLTGSKRSILKAARQSSRIGDDNQAIKKIKNYLNLREKLT